MRALKFRLRGKTAFFKNPEVNSYVYFTFGQIHKPALLGIFGAVMGYRGYEAGYEDYPEYYEKLQRIRVSVIPESQTGYFSKKIQSFNNSVGYASQEQGGNLIVREQWIEQPSWMIYVWVEDEISRKLDDAILKKTCTYIPYLGKNDHPAVLEEAAYVELSNLTETGVRLHSLVPADAVEYDWFEASFKYEEYLPLQLKRSTNLYVLQKYFFTDAQVLNVNVPVYRDGEINIVFY